MRLSFVLLAIAATLLASGEASKLRLFTTADATKDETNSEERGFKISAGPVMEKVPVKLSKWAKIRNQFARPFPTQATTGSCTRTVELGPNGTIELSWNFVL